MASHCERWFWPGGAALRLNLPHETLQRQLAVAVVAALRIHQALGYEIPNALRCFASGCHPPTVMRSNGPAATTPAINTSAEPSSIGFNG